mmetsp:Transcript_14359/g.16698  ORF Transcript_14359/g.16698 Transcript_14359/m.16698 type:complete len:420 (+) Transcript_14359:154-1413(+)
MYNQFISNLCASILMIIFIKNQSVDCSFAPNFSTTKRRNVIPTTIHHLPSKSSSLLSSSSTSSSLLASSSTSSSSSSSVTINIPQFHPDEKTPIHQNSYPSSLHKIHVQSLLTKIEASKCLEIANSYATQSGCWSAKDSDRHASYSTVDFPIDECDTMETYLNECDFYTRLWNLLSVKYDIDVEDLSFEDFFCAHYQAKGDDDCDPAIRVMDYLEPHRDGSLLSFTIVLSEPDSYIGGGTSFDALRDVNPNDFPEYNGVLCENGVIRVNNPGDAVIHSGKIKHGGHTVTKGERTVIVGFVEVNDNIMRDGVVKETCKEWGRVDFASKRLKRQIQKTSNEQEKNGWQTNVSKYTSKGHSQSVVPAFSSVKKRANEEYQRLKNLQVEDILLRDILLERNERKQKLQIPDELASQFSDVTIL